MLANKIDYLDNFLKFEHQRKLVQEIYCKGKFAKEIILFSIRFGGKYKINLLLHIHDTL